MKVLDLAVKYEIKIDGSLTKNIMEGA